MENTRENQDTVARLLELQDLYLKIFALERDMESIPGRVGDIKVRLARYHEDIENGRSVLKSRQAAVKKLELDIEAQKQQARKYREQQLQLKSNDAFKAMNTEIANVEKLISQLGDRQLVGMEDADAAREIDSQGRLPGKKDRCRRKYRFSRRGETRLNRSLPRPGPKGTASLRERIPRGSSLSSTWRSISRTRL